MFLCAASSTFGEYNSHIPMFVEEIVTSGETKPNTNEACSVPTCPDVTNIYMPCCNYSIELSNWICKIWIQVGGGDESKTEKKKELHFFLSDGDETVHWSTTAVCVCVWEARALYWTRPASWHNGCHNPHSQPPAYFPAGIHLGMHMGATALPG